MDCCKDTFSKRKLWERWSALAYGAFNCTGRHTITGMLSASGRQFKDWSADYRLFSNNRVDNDKIFDVICDQAIEQLEPDRSIVAHMDDTLIKKSGRHIPGTAWRRDPLGPPFHTNFIWGQRFLQISLSLPSGSGACSSRAIPVEFHHCPTAKKPGRKATKEQILQYKEAKKRKKLSTQGKLRIEKLRQRLDQQGYGQKPLIVSVDGSYTNKEVFRDLPVRTKFIGRIRCDAAIYALPSSGRSGSGRGRSYGEQLPTPEQIRQSDEFPWIQVKAWAAGKVHLFNVKQVKQIRWRPAGEHKVLQLVVIAPLGYRLTKSSKTLYRSPSYLACTDPELGLEELIQAFLWRWEIEVNFREEKTVMGCGQAQVRNPHSAEAVPGFVASIYAMLHLAAHKALKSEKQYLLPRPNWYKKQDVMRHTTGDLINNIRAQAWTESLGLDFKGFVRNQCIQRSLRNSLNPFVSAMFYARN